MVDLGAWLTGAHAIAGEPIDVAPEAVGPGEEELTDSSRLT
jgi:endogenous inhibitor of DNA gyrase (YacG/DUF329 family)